jgi:hypothetical protein
VIEFVEECRGEWKRLGVPDPIANEMAADLTADIEEAEAEGGSAEDVLGTSLFDPRRFAAAWAGARGVTGPPVSVDPPAPPIRERHPWYRPVTVVALAGVGFLMAVAAAALVVGRHSSAVAAPVRRILSMPGSTRLFGPSQAVPPFRNFVPGPSFVVQNAGPFAIVAFALLLVGVVVVGLAVLYWSPWSPWSRRDSKRRLG